MFKVNNKNIRYHHTCRSGVFIVDFEHIFHLYLSVFIVDFEQVNPSLGMYLTC